MMVVEVLFGVFLFIIAARLRSEAKWRHGSGLKLLTSLICSLFILFSANVLFILLLSSWDQVDYLRIVLSNGKVGSGTRYGSPSALTVSLALVAVVLYVYCIKTLIIQFLDNPTRSGAVRPSMPSLVGSPIGQLRRIGFRDACHVIDNASVCELPSYDSTSAPAVRLAGTSVAKGTSRYLATEVMRQPGGGTYAAERRIGYKALRRAGLNRFDARQKIKQADVYFSGIGVTPETVTRVPRRRWREALASENPLEEAVRSILAKLARKEFALTIQNFATSRLTAGELAEIMQQYKATFVEPPINAGLVIDAILVDEARLPTWSIRVPLWSMEEGPSDLTLELIVVREGDRFAIELDDIR